MRSPIIVATWAWYWLLLMYTCRVLSMIERESWLRTPTLQSCHLEGRNDGIFLSVLPYTPILEWCLWTTQLLHSFATESSQTTMFRRKITHCSKHKIGCCWGVLLVWASNENDDYMLLQCCRASIFDGFGYHFYRVVGSKQYVVIR